MPFLATMYQFVVNIYLFFIHNVFLILQIIIYIILLLLLISFYTIRLFLVFGCVVVDVEMLIREVCICSDRFVFIVNGFCFVLVIAIFHLRFLISITPQICHCWLLWSIRYYLRLLSPFQVIDLSSILSDGS